MDAPPPSPTKKGKKKKVKVGPSGIASSSSLPTAPPALAPSLQLASPPPTPIARPPNQIVISKRRKCSPWFLYTLLSFLIANFSTLLFLLTVISSYFILTYLGGTLHSFLSSLFSSPSNLLSLIPHPSHLTLAPAITLYCSTIGLGCTRGEEDDVMGGVARTVTVQASQALDLFDSVLHLGKADGVGSSLHHVAEEEGRANEGFWFGLVWFGGDRIWELAVAVRHTSAFENKDFLAGQLQELGDATREVKDSVHEFTRLEELIERVNTKPTSSSLASLSSLLSSLYSKISSDLSSLLHALDKSISVADQASSLGGLLMGALASEATQLQREKDDVGVWKSLMERKGWKGKQMKRDLKLAEESVKGVRGLRMNLEAARSAFLEYSANVGFFKAGIVGYAISGHGLSAEDEIASLRSVLVDFRRTLHEAKGSRHSTSSGRPELDPPPINNAGAIG
ncbi:hypothetical protein P7C70_g695, partial [Phenoliferia sp. Uapishka_3]